MKTSTKSRRMKKFSVIMLTFAILLTVINPISAFAQTPDSQNNTLLTSQIQSYAAQPNYWEGATAHFYPDRGAAMQFTGNKLTAVSTASVLSGSYKSITICLVWDSPGFPVVSGTTKTIYPNGQSYTLFRDISITSGASYRLQYVVNTSDPIDTASISTGLASWTDQ